MLLSRSGILAEAICTTIWPKINPHWFISFISARPFDQIIWSSFIYYFFWAKPFDQKLGSTRGVGRIFLEGGSRSSRMPGTMADWYRKSWVKERLKRYISDLFHWNFAYSNMSFLAAELFFLLFLLIDIRAGWHNTCIGQLKLVWTSYFFRVSSLTTK